ncbi:hypothetical protein EVB94_223 [Rhizobium phage RHph_TM40]|uniref:Uncharacterized protein n=2 Tax=Cuauhnahuacvirus TaxID=3044696 RepID=A0A7S5RC44_9CAUD|nr:hypothetical protein PQC16_gp223 [Rhizobium phage RHph_TM30]YP_010671372.1 hypothetical protein PQC17_gp223 [Rhizobium phage RHph_Y65]QIG71694.1 hypothetical protein EVB94_223 [Rhizobium phage RHph_TM40]QIG72057.1 hypothetical protein EVB95_223 [Rhizobium phage RHph_TM2_3B]QIG72419.1 hypothetical protein EVB96_223 [Rhizobium phage RHph_TM3_3_6]QIG71330.1 hypothetical protein EVB93_223 [Rhizobium phage RHph_TM30]QIG72781.1 hypothetical protein EVB97_223 [Rhizobium phage RHph_Y65]
MKHNLSTLKTLYSIDKKSAASLMAMLCSLNEGEEFHSNLGRIKKDGENSFKIIFNNNTINNIVDELTDDGNISKIFD